MASRDTAIDWANDLFQVVRDEGIRHVATVPDGGLEAFLDRCDQAPELNLVTLTTEEEGVALACGAWLGGQLAVVAIQSSGVGNILNMLALPSVCGIPCLLLVSMRGESEETNPWQIPMGQAVPDVLETLGVSVFRPEEASDVGAAFSAAVRAATNTGSAAAVLISQRIIGVKSFESATRVDD